MAKDHISFVQWTGIGSLWLIFAIALYRAYSRHRLQKPQSKRIWILFFLWTIAFSLWGDAAEITVNRIFGGLPVGLYVKCVCMMLTFHGYSQILKPMRSRAMRMLADMPKNKSEAPPISSLHDILAASSHSIITFAPEVYEAERAYPPWIYTTANITLDTYRLLVLTNKWIQAVGGINRISNAEEIHWDCDTIHLTRAEFQLQRMIIPNLIARWLIMNGFQLQLAGRDYPLRLVPMISKRRYVAELITEPVIHEDTAYSFVMRFWLVQLPSKSEPILLHKSGIRRWTNKRVFIMVAVKVFIYDVLLAIWIRHLVKTYLHASPLETSGGTK